MKAEIITIGDEILIGQIVDTNSAFIASELNKIGVLVHQITSIQDDRQHILTAFKEAELRADIIIVTLSQSPKIISVKIFPLSLCTTPHHRAWTSMRLSLACS